MFSLLNDCHALWNLVGYSFEFILIVSVIVSVVSGLQSSAAEIKQHRLIIRQISNEQLTKKELITIAKQHKIKYSGLNKAELSHQLFLAVCL